MEVHRKDYWQKHLLPILQHISKASFVAFDLEFSGIRPTQQRTKTAGKPSIQQLYEENREVAQKFQVLQVGITCMEENREKGYYVARPYNFYLSPLSIKKPQGHKPEFSLDRLISFSSETCEFLREHNLDLGKVFSDGVHYLSVEEERNLTKTWEDKSNERETISDILIKPNDAPALEFYRDAKKRIKDWVDDESISKASEIAIVNKSGPMNGFQRRLIYQLVRKEFPEYRARSRDSGAFMKIEFADLEEESRMQERKRQYLERDLAKQTGLRWIFEALSNGDLDGIDARWLCELSPEDSGYVKELDRKRQELYEVKEELMVKEHIIVGHNLFTDLCFLYNTFFEPLPISVKNFQSEIHTLFPTIYDSKFLVSYGHGNLRPNTPLMGLLEPFKLIHRPIISLHPDEGYQNYRDASINDKAHEAGFDSWATAELFAKLSVKLYDDRKSTLSADSESDAEYEDLTQPPEALSTPSSSPSSSSSSITNTITSEGGVKLTPSPAPFASINKFAALDITDEDNLPASYFAQQMNTPKVDRRELMPKFSGEFWEIYRNKLQVNASEAGFCDLAEYDDEI